MGCAAVIHAQHKAFNTVIGDSFLEFSQIVKKLTDLGISRQLHFIVGVDFTSSNLETGKRCYGGLSLHDVNAVARSEYNPYLQALHLLAEACQEMQADRKLYAYGFGDAQSGADYIFSFHRNDGPLTGFDELIHRYTEIAKAITLGGPTSFAPLIRQAIKRVRETRDYHILFIFADGNVSQSDKLATELALQEASRYPLSIVMVGVGDGPWDIMVKYDDKLKRRCFDNFQFVEFQMCFHRHATHKRKDAFALDAFMEVPAQYTMCKAMLYLSEHWPLPEKYVEPPLPFGPPDNPNITDPNYGVLLGFTAVYDRNRKAHFYWSPATGDSYWDKPVKKTSHKRLSNLWHHSIMDFRQQKFAELPLEPEIEEPEKRIDATVGNQLALHDGYTTVMMGESSFMYSAG